MLAAGAAYFVWEHGQGRARAAAPAVPAVLAGKDRPGPRGIRRAQPGRPAGTGLTDLPAEVSHQPLTAADVHLTEIADHILTPLIS